MENIKKLKLIENDPKANSLVEKIKEELSKKAGDNEPKRKIIVFSEYADTVNHLRPILEKHFPKKVLTVAGDLSKQTIGLLAENFDAGNKNQKDDFEILLATDRISEGFNLNRAGMIINYDIPWNPVRVIQRVGRINRIGKKVFEKLYIVNFFPTEQGAEYVQSRKIAANKMFMIHNILGEDVQIFDSNEKRTPANLYKKIQSDPDEQEESFDTKIYNEFHKIKRENPKLVERLETFPPRVKVAKNNKNKSLLVFIKKGSLYIKKVTENEKGEIEVKVASLEKVYKEIKCGKDEKKMELSDKFWRYYKAAKNYKSKQSSSRSEQSIEVKASNMLNSLLRQSGLEECKTFLETLREDMDRYETLTPNSLRRIAKMPINNISKLKNELGELRKDLGGENYLELDKQRTKNINKELIIAVENR